MSDVNQLVEDVRFVRSVVENRERNGNQPLAVCVYWAAYVLVGYTMLDLAPKWAGWFFLVGGVGGGIATAYISKRAAKLHGEIDRENGRRAMLHWFWGMLLAIAAVVGLATVIPALRGSAGSQVLVVIIGMIYYLAGVHGMPNMKHLLWAGPIAMAGGICVGLIPHYGWTALGVLIAFCILIPVLRPRQVRHG